MFNIFVMDFEISEPSDRTDLFRLLKITQDAINDLDDYINNITRTMMGQSLNGYISCASLLVQTKCTALGIQNIYFMYHDKISSYITGDLNNRRVNSYPVPNNSQEIGYINKVMCMEFNSENRSS